MCTAVVFKSEDYYFGRNLDLEYSYNEAVAITPRNFNFTFRKTKNVNLHHSIIGMAYVNDGYPLYYDAINEKGLGIAGLNFPYNAHYFEEKNDKINLAPFEFIPYILSLCSDVKEAKALLTKINICNINFSHALPNTPLHWIITDGKASITVESLKDGLIVYDNRFGVLTNNPPFNLQVLHWEKYKNLSAYDTENKALNEYFTRADGAVGLPGDWSSMSRYAKAVFVKENSRCNVDEKESVGQFFHILSSVEMVKGCIRIGDKDDITVYSSCCNLDKGLYYYTTYYNRQINCIDMHKENLDATKLISYHLQTKENIFYQN
ncbi:MAG: choloylglycine hydrolase [Clostridia bacterium]|nr:choloylglycine hydrolase [Clostridia bacterium]